MKLKCSKLKVNGNIYVNIKLFTYFKPLFKSEFKSKFSDKVDVPLSDSVLEFVTATTFLKGEKSGFNSEGL